jgi:hypothetical protein
MVFATLILPTHIPHHFPSKKNCAWAELCISKWVVDMPNCLTLKEFQVSWYSCEVYGSHPNPRERVIHCEVYGSHPNPRERLNRIDRILISTRYTFFSGSSSEKNSGLSVLGLERFGDGWPTEKSFPDAHEWGQSTQKRLVLVCGASLEILESCQG